MSLETKQKNLPQEKKLIEMEQQQKTLEECSLFSVPLLQRYYHNTVMVLEI